MAAKKNLNQSNKMQLFVLYNKLIFVSLVPQQFDNKKDIRWRYQALQVNEINDVNIYR